jgi:hypothetical protein
MYSLIHLSSNISGNANTIGSILSIYPTPAINYLTVQYNLVNSVSGGYFQITDLFNQSAANFPLSSLSGGTTQQVIPISGYLTRDYLLKLIIKII